MWVDLRAWSKPGQVVAEGACVSVKVQGKGECRADCYCSWMCACVCLCEPSFRAFVLLLHRCCATSAFNNTSSPTGFTQGTCNLSNKALFVRVCAYEKEIEIEKKREVTASLTKDSLMHSCWKMKLQVKAANIFFSIFL